MGIHFLYKDEKKEEFYGYSGFEGFPDDCF